MCYSKPSINLSKTVILTNSQKNIEQNYFESLHKGGHHEKFSMKEDAHGTKG